MGVLRTTRLFRGDRVAVILLFNRTARNLSQCVAHRACLFQYGTTNESVTLDISHLLYIEAVGNYVKLMQIQDGEVKTSKLKELLE